MADTMGAAQSDLTADQAFDLLSRDSQRLNMKLGDLAAQIADRRRKPVTS